ncbi:phosphoribosylamine--glycine ligase [Helicobacter baculiformis]|uniref:Phosphoribosylamine--glycine ligase n=1 Tax=Helicobacter baculiformis TaxID=427351 RepID=A0ABV7ZFH2_9HELI|nr:phosphoribosylamine--glycine ligase [Helicobacter baculiformis]
MKIAIIGGGGREHAILKKIKSPDRHIFMVPGNAGMATEATCVNLSTSDTEGILNFAKQQKLDFIIVSPDNPLVEGLVDCLEEAGFACFGPRKCGARLEGSKIFAKEFMQRHQIPTASYHAFENLQQAQTFLKQTSFPCVIKADGLAFGKGVVIARNLQEGMDALKEMMEDKIFGESGTRVLIEEFLEGKEVSVLAFCDGLNLKIMPPAMDYKKALEGNQGLNTGGMGCIAPNPYFNEKIAQECQENIFLPTLKGMREENLDFRGCLYFGLILSAKGVKVLEYNCRFGDPEAQTLLPLLQNDLLEIMQACSKKQLASQEVCFSTLASCCVVLASQGYPQHFETGNPISYPSDLEICFAGVKHDQGKLVNSSGRVLSITSSAPTLEEARELSYERIAQVSLANGYYRRDIAQI